jgi:2-haloacid dehalogenase
MRHNRRAILKLGAVAATAALFPSLGEGAAPKARRAGAIKAIAFDGFPVIDPRPVARLCEEMFPGKGAGLIDAWRTRQFEYTWLRTLSNRYVDFWHITEDALTFAAGSRGLDLSTEGRARLMNSWLKLGVWPEAVAELRAMKEAGIRIAFLSNLTARMLDAALGNAGLRDVFGEHLSTDRVQAYKPDPRAYQMGLDAFALPREQILFVASAGWDAAGARWFGYPTYWVNRLDQPAEQLGVELDGVGKDLHGVTRFVLG